MDNDNALARVHLPILNSVTISNVNGRTVEISKTNNLLTIELK